MFGLLRNLYVYLRNRAERHLVLVLTGLDNAGKTTLLAAIRGEVPGNTQPTWGFSTEKYETDNYKIDLYDLGGGKNIRKIWGRYYAEVHGCIFVVDAADEARLEEAKLVLHEMLADPLMAGKPLLIFANKQDLPRTLKAAELSARLDLPALKDRRYQVVESIAKPPEGSTALDKRVSQGTKWLLSSIEKDFSDLGERVEREAAAARAEEQRKVDERRKRVEAQKAERQREREEEERLAASKAAGISGQGNENDHGDGEIAANGANGAHSRAGEDTRGAQLMSNGTAMAATGAPTVLTIPGEEAPPSPSPSPSGGLPPGALESPGKVV